MRDLLELLAVLAALAAVCFCLVVLGMYRVLLRANRVVAHQASAAPLSWRWHPGRLARLHRRLRRLCGVVGALAPHRPRLTWRRRASVAGPSALAIELIDEAVALDARLVSVARLADPWRRPALVDLESEVARLEDSASRLVNLAYAWATPPSPSLPPDLHDRVQALDQAYEELGRWSGRVPPRWPPAPAPQWSRPAPGT